MRKAQKNQAEEFLKVLEEAHGQIRAMAEKKNVPAVLEILEDCQQGALSLGNMIETAEGEGCAVIPLLERYCELVWQFYEELSQGKALNGNKMHKLLRSFLLRIENSVRNDIKVRVEAVFLPYKASMWDSLESIWKAADADPDCDAYVIPIPYYDKNPDGSFREMHYEGSLYPADVPVMWYGNYDFEKRRPDMIYIHNPYDKYNYVTSVHPDFYSENLKRYTDNLVYVPYFMLQEISPDDKVSVDKIAHFCTSQGVFNADKVVVQSEDMRQVYINVLTEYAKKYGYTRKDWEEKIVGLGSPKIDKILNTKKEDLYLPEEWIKIIGKSDGSYKKVVFYNTNVGALLKHEGKMLEKIKDVFKLFEEKRDEVALLWRPHPLMKATIGSMRPQLWEEYEKVEREYRDAGWGIYDDSAELDRAIAMSGGYYGDLSSVASLCQKAGIKVMFQNVNIGNKSERALGFEALAKIDASTAYAASDSFNSLFEVDMSTGNCTYLGMFPNEKPDGKRLYTAAVPYEGEIYFVPCSADKIAVYDIAEKDFMMLDVKGVDSRKYPFYRPQSKFNGGMAYGTWIYMVCCTYPGIIRIDVKTKKIEYFDDWISGEYTFRKSPYIDDDKFYIPSVINNSVLRFNMDTCEGKLYSVGKNNSGCWSMCRLGDAFWLAPQKEGPIIKWNPETGVSEEYDEYPGGFKSNGFVFSKIYARQGAVYLLPVYANMLLQVSAEEGTVSDSGILNLSDDSAVYYMFCDDDFYYLKILSGNKKKYLRLDIERNKTDEYLFRFSGNTEKFIREYWKAVHKDRRFIREQESFGLREFLDAIETFDENDLSDEVFVDGCIGSEIFRKVKSGEW